MKYVIPLSILLLVIMVIIKKFLNQNSKSEKHDFSKIPSGPDHSDRPGKADLSKNVYENNRRSLEEGISNLDLDSKK